MRLNEQVPFNIGTVLTYTAISKQIAPVIRDA